MIRKQLYITETQDRALKQRARELGVSEAEVARRALDRMLDQTNDSFPTPRQRALDELLTTSRRLAEHHTFPDDYSFDRATLYHERAARWITE